MQKTAFKNSEVYGEEEARRIFMQELTHATAEEWHKKRDWSQRVKQKKLEMEI